MIEQESQRHTQPGLQCNERVTQDLSPQISKPSPPIVTTSERRLRTFAHKVAPSLMGMSLFQPLISFVVLKGWGLESVAIGSFILFILVCAGHSYFNRKDQLPIFQRYWLT